MRHLFTVTCLVAAAFLKVHSQDAKKDCVDGSSRWYVGNVNKTASGRTCQRWDVDVPHKPKHTPLDGPNHNYCRNPDVDLRGTWCYTTDNNTRWEYCNITKCHDDSLVIWTSYNSTTESTHLLKVHADPEVVRQVTDSNGSFSVNILTGSNQTMTEYWALAAHYHKQLLYFTDYRSEYVAVWDMRKNQMTKYFEGMAHGIECLAFDWKTNNLYWTDSEFKWVMAADDTFKYYAPVYRTAPAPAYGLAIHSAKRYLIFSTYKALGSKIIRTDLAGQNETVLFKFPSIFDVTGLAIDYTDDRLYWTDFTGYGGMIVSARMDGTNRTQHNYRGGSIYWGVAPYMDYLYASDVHARYSVSGDRHYTVWIIRKISNQVYRYTLGGKPRGIAVYSHNEEYSIDTASKIGECNSDFECDHICLPSINTARKCACSLGYHLDTNTNKCIPQLVKDNFLLVADAGQGKVFQIPIVTKKDDKNITQYSIVPIGGKWKAATVTVDPSQKYLYWSDKKESSVSRSSVDGSRYVKVASSYANSIIVDPHTGLLFYSDNEKDSIMIAQGDGTYAKTIVKPDPALNETSSIRMIVQDIKYKYIYWTDTFSKEDQGKVMRCRYDGTEKEVVLDKLNWPHAITIDYKTNRLYVAEARDAMIYEVELSSLTKINNTSAKQKTIKQYDVSTYISRVSPYIIDLKIHLDMAYVVDGKSSRLERFNLSEGVTSMTPFGPAEFFRVTTVSVFSETFYSTYIKPVRNPCAKSECRHMCIALSDTVTKCICADGHEQLGNNCIRDTSLDKEDTSAPEPQNCPDNVEIFLPTCSATTHHSWTPPTWTDDKTAANDLAITLPLLTSPAKLTAGRSQITYSAKDKAGNVGYCVFTVNVIDNQCVELPSISSDMKSTSPSCGYREGSIFTVSCKDSTLWVTSPSLTPNKYNQFKSYDVTCGKDRRWSTLSWASTAECKPPITTTPVITTTTIQSTPRAITATSSTTSPAATPATERIPSRPSAPRTTTDAPATRTKIVTKKTTSTPAATTLENINQTMPLNVGKQSAPASAMTPGIVAVIVVLVIVLVIIIVVVAVFAIRNRPAWAVTRFPVFWKSGDTDAVKMESSGQSYEIMT